MKFLRLFLFLTTLLLFNACRSDESIEDTGPNPNPTENPIAVTGNLTGLVVDETQQPIAGAFVELGEITTSTDENGIFSFDNVVALSIGSLVNINKDGYYDAFKFIRFESDQNSILKVQMVTKEILTSFQSTEEATIDVNGAKVYLPENIATRADGSAYNGVVNVTAHWYDPTDENTITAMPGDLRGIDAAGLAVQLTTYGMMAVELSDGSGEELILKEGMNATLTFPLPPNANGPDQIPMWHLDEETGVWLEEGMATKMGAAMVAEVPHFSFWNCDVPFEVVDLKGRIVSNLGTNPISGLQIVITDNNQMISGYGYTNNNGIFSGAVPSGNDLTMTIFHCGELISISNIGILTEDTDLGDITLDIENQIDLTATLVDCDGASIEEGIALISIDNHFELVVANNGQVNNVMFPCNGEEGTFQAYSNTNNGVSELLSFDLEESFVDLGEVEVCDGTSLVEVITYSYNNGEQVNFTDVTVSIVDNTFLHIYADEGEGFSSNSIELRYYLDGTSELMGVENKITLRIRQNIGWQSVEISDPGATWNIVSGLQVGDIVSGILDNHPTENIEVLYNLTIDQIVTTPRVTGKVWIDTDEDGIRDTEENDLPPNFEINPINIYSEIFNYYEYTELNSDGTYSTKGLVPNREYLIDASGLVPDFQVTSYQQGNDPSIDNDFLFDGQFIITERFTLENGEILSNIDLGIK